MTGNRLSKNEVEEFLKLVYKKSLFYILGVIQEILKFFVILLYSIVIGHLMLSEFLRIPFDIIFNNL